MDEQEEKNIDQYMFCTNYKPFDINIIKSRFPFSRDQMTAFLKTMEPGDLIHIMALPVCMLRPVSFLEDLSSFLDSMYLLYTQDFSALGYEEKVYQIVRYILVSYPMLHKDMRYPCNPIVGETFASYVMVNDIRISFIAEQKSNRPNTSFFHIRDDHNLFQIQGTVQPRALFGGSSILQDWDGFIELSYLPTGERYTLNFPSIHLSNILYGKEELQLVGTLQITSNENPLQTSIEYLAKPSIGGDSRVVRVLVKNGDRLISRIQGRWDIGYELIDENTKEISEFLMVRNLIPSKKWVLSDEKQQPMESLQMWKPLRQAMIANSQEEVIKVLEMMDKKRREWNQKCKESSKVFDKTAAGEMVVKEDINFIALSNSE